MIRMRCSPRRPINASSPARCPFCGRRPSGKKFCMTAQGPALVCACGAMGPPALPKGEDYFYKPGPAERCLERKAAQQWNERPAKGSSRDA